MSFAFDIESNHADRYNTDWEFWCLSTADETGGNIFYYPEDFDVMVDTFKSLTSEDEIIAHNGKFDLTGLRRAGIINSYLVNGKPLRIRDTMVGLNLLDENLTIKELGLKSSIYRIFGYKMAELEDSTFFGKHSEEFKKYSIDDSVQTLRLWTDYVKPGLIQEGLLYLFEKVYMQNLIFACYMEDAGIFWDVEECERLTENYKQYRDTMERKVRDVLGEDINLNSPEQLKKKFFGELGLDENKADKTKKGDISVGKSTLITFSKECSVCADLLAFRNAEKMLNTYLEPYPKKTTKTIDGRLHPDIWMMSKTGRKRFQNPAVPTLPVVHNPDYNIRLCLGTSSKTKLAVVDLSQIELRLCAQITKDPEMSRAYTHYQCKSCGVEGDHHSFLTHCPNCGLEGDERTIKKDDFIGFWHGLDIHSMSANQLEIPRDPGDSVDACAKNCNFALIYYCMAKTMKQQFGTYSVSQWEEIINRFFRKYVMVKKWHTWSEEKFKETLVSKDIFGRKRRFSKKDLEKGRYKRALNEFINFQIQSSAAHYLMLANNHLMQVLDEAGIWAKFIYPVSESYDEGVWEVNSKLAQEAFDLIVYEYRYALPSLRIPINAEGEIADKWGEAK